MGITAISGPTINFGITQSSSGAVGDYNDQRGPSLFDLGQGMLDPRSFFNYSPGSAVTDQVYGFYHSPVAVVDYIPFAADSSAIYRSTTGAPVAGTALALVAQSSVGSFQTTIIAPETGLAVSVIALDSTAATLNFGNAGTVAIWNPNAGTGRALTVINTSNANAETYIVNGRDAYGIKMSETISASTTSTGSGQGKKAFKYISSVTPSTATTISATGVRIGFTDTFGFPILAGYLGMTTVQMSTSPLVPSTVVLTSANSVLGSTVATATATTPDARGTYTASAAFVTNGTSATIADGTGVRIRITQTVSALAASTVTSSNQASIFGITQFSAV